MKENNVIQYKSFRFGLNIIRLCKDLKDNKKETIISNQLLRASTSVGANVEEGLGCQSQKDFYFKFTIAYKEARESMYWLKLIEEAGLCQKETVTPIIADCQEILKIIGSILKTIRNKYPNSHNS
jgi:four helix bundle protein